MTRIWTPDQPYQRFSLLSTAIKFSANGTHIVTPDMGWIKVGTTRWLWLLDGMFYIEDDRRLTPGFPTRAGAAVPLPPSPVPAAMIRSALGEAREAIARAERALAQG